MTARPGLLTGLFSLVALAAGCGSPDGSTRGLRVLLAANERPFWVPIARRFEAANPGVRVGLVEGPTSTDLREGMYTTALLARDDSLDLVYMDVTWTAKFAAAGWLLPLDEAFPGRETEAFLPEALEAGRFRGRLYRVPVRTDVGVLYRRLDLLGDRAAPRTFEELSAAARALQDPPRLWGYLWQGAQYEGLVCAFLEVLHGHGGYWIEPRTLDVGLDRPEAVAALSLLLRFRDAEGITPPGVTAYREDETRLLFQGGRAVFLRNWPYVRRLAEREESAVRGAVGVSRPPTVDGREGAGTLGGWGLGVSRYARDPGLAVAFVRHAVTLRSQRDLCGPTGFLPARSEAWDDPVLLAANPYLGELRPLQAGAIRRPAVARYAQVSDVLQRALTSALSGLASPEEALAGAARRTRAILGGAR